MADTFPYIVKDGMRWDTVSYLAYGRASLIDDLITANPEVPITERLPPGTVLQIPVKDTAAVQTNSELLPPWKQ
jgi:hypothetical protein